MKTMTTIQCIYVYFAPTERDEWGPPDHNGKGWWMRWWDAEGSEHNAPVAVAANASLSKAIDAACFCLNVPFRHDVFVVDSARRTNTKETATWSESF